MKKSEMNTKNRLKQLSKSLGDFEIEKLPKDTKKRATFKTSEVVILLLLTVVVGLVMGGLITYNIVYGNAKRIDDELQSFVKNYEYIINNYYGKVDKSDLVDSAIAGMLTTLDKNSAYVGSVDSDFNIYLEGTYDGAGIQVYNNEKDDIVVYKVIDDSPASKAGLKDGDIIVKVKDKSTVNMNISEFSSLIKKEHESFEITFKRNDKEMKTKISIEKIELKSVTSKLIKRNNKKMGYIKTTIFANNTYKQFKKQLSELEKANLDSLVIDLRGNSGGHLMSAENILGLFLDSKHPIYQIKTKNETEKFYSKGKKTKKYKIAILVDGSSASASEIVTAALKEQYGATVVGEKTFGKGTVQELQTLPSGGQYKLTTKIWLTSKGNKIDGKGIKPNIEIKADENDENDKQLEKAIEVLLG